MKDFKRVQSTFIRSANTASYTAGDIVSSVSGSWYNQKLTLVNKQNNAGICIDEVILSTNDTGAAGTKFNIRFYDDIPTTPFTPDNNPFTSSYSNASKFIGLFPVVMGSGNTSLMGINDYNIAIGNPVNRELYYTIESVTGYTPLLTSSLFTLSIGYQASNPF